MTKCVTFIIENNFDFMSRINIYHYYRYYMSTLDDGPWQKHLWVGGSKSQCITCDLELPDGDICRNAGVSLSPGGKFYALSCHGEGPALVTINRAEVSEYL